MEDAIDNIEADVYSLYLHSFDDNISDEKKIEELAERFNISTHEVEQIVHSDE